MAKIKNDYFKLIEEQVHYCVQAGILLEEIFSTYSVDAVSEQKIKMHDIEHKADELHHDISTRLMSEFITPIDQEDILHLVQIVDDVTDSIDEVVFDIYMYNITELPKNAQKLASIVNRCVKALYEAVNELKNFKKPDALRKLLVDVNDIESESDEVVTDAVRELFVECDDVKKIIGHKAVYESLENCCDLCEHASDIIEQIIIKNT